MTTGMGIMRIAADTRETGGTVFGCREPDRERDGVADFGAETVRSG